jgi:hypothetical protein
MHTSVSNTSDGSGSASEQNLASNAGTFTSSNTLSQTVNANHSLISNDSFGGGRATQNIASNAGTSGLYTTTHQLASITHSSVINRAFLECSGNTKHLLEYQLHYLLEFVFGFRSWSWSW